MEQLSTFFLIEEWQNEGMREKKPNKLFQMNFPLADDGLIILSYLWGRSFL